MVKALTTEQVFEWQRDAVSRRGGDTLPSSLLNRLDIEGVHLIDPNMPNMLHEEMAGNSSIRARILFKIEDSDEPVTGFYGIPTRVYNAAHTVTQSPIEEICSVGGCERPVKQDGVISGYCDRHQYAGTTGRG